MNIFTKEELDSLLNCVDVYIGGDTLIKHHYREIGAKLQSLIDNYREYPWDSRKIAESHLREAESLISHAMCLLDMKEK